MEPETPRSPWLSRWDLLPLLAGLGLGVVLPNLLRGLPDPLPTHFDRAGHPNGWTPHAVLPWIVLGLPALIWLLILLTGRATVGSSQDPDGRKAVAMAPVRSLSATGVLLLMGSVTLIPRFGLGVMGWAVAGFLALMALGIGFMVRDLKAMARPLPGDASYRWGLFYANAQDPRLWVPKRFGVGWTLNFGHGASWLILALILAIPALGIAFTFLR